MTRATLSARIYLRLRPLYARLLAGLEAGWLGLWLGALDRADFHAIDAAYYQQAARYHDDVYTARGLFPWEAEAVDALFPPAGRLLLLGAGGGREAFALAARGYRVEGHECHPALVAYAGEFLSRHASTATVRLVARDELPITDGPFASAIIGWSAYTLMAGGRTSRVGLLRGLRPLLSDGAPLLLSFFTRGDELTPRERMIARVGSMVRRLRRRAPVEPGDDLSPNFVHRFTFAEVAAELREGGFEIVHFAPQGAGPFDSGWAVGIAGSRPTA